MGLFDRLFGEFVDVIEWTDDSSNTMVYRFERYGNEIKYGAKLVVRESQYAVFVNEGQVADVLGPGTWELQTKNLPVLTTLKSWQHGFQSPFKAEVYFCNARRFTDLKWGTKQPLMLRDSEFGGLRLRAFGTYTTRIVDPLKFIREIVGTEGVFTTDEISAQLRNLITARFATIIGSSDIPVLDMAANQDQLGEFLHRRIAPEFGEYGLELTKLLVENVSLPPAVSEALDKRTAMGMTGNLDAYLKYQAGEGLAKGGGAGNDAIGMGVGMAMGRSMAEGVAGGSHASGGAGAGGSSAQANADGGASSDSAASDPPPLRNPPRFHVALDGRADGPHSLETLGQMIGTGQLRQDTLVWSPEMSEWAKAGSVPGLGALFGERKLSPPPLPS